MLVEGLSIIVVSAHCPKWQLTSPRTSINERQMSTSGHSFWVGLSCGIAFCAVSHYILQLTQDSLSIVYGPPSPSALLGDRTAAPRETSSAETETAHSGSGGHRHPKREDSPPPSYSTDDVYARLESELMVPSAKLSKMVKHLVSEMKKGLASFQNQTLKMLPSYVTKRPAGTETGTVLALDLGGSNFRICLKYLNTTQDLSLTYKRQ